MKENRCNAGKDVTLDEQKYILAHFSYNAETGMITRDDRRNSNGSIDKDGYLILKIKSKQYKAHRIAWLLYYGTLPMKEIDHINHNRTDNRISNLREVDRFGNHKNIRRSPNKDTGIVGVYEDKRTIGLKKKFCTRIGGKTYRFYSIDEARNFRIKKKYQHERVN